MKLVVFTVAGHIYANQVIKQLILSDHSIVAIVASTRLHPNHSNLEAVKKYISVSGWYYTAVQIGKVFLYRVASYLYHRVPWASEMNTLYSSEVLARKKSVRYIRVDSIELREIVSLLKDLKADMFVSVFFNLVFKPRHLKIPRLGTINIHPSLLPSYRGVSPTFWVLANGKRHTGVTIHRVDDARIDKGLILSQKKVAIFQTDTEHSLYKRCAEEAVPLLLRVLKGDKQQENRKRPLSSYYSLPTSAAVRKFKQRGRSFFTLSEILK